MKRVLLFILICLPLCFFGCDKQNVVKLNAPKNLAVENGIISFERVAHEGYYSITINELEILADINNSNVEIYSLNDANYFAYNAQNLLTVGVPYTIKVQAHADGKKSSDVVSASYLHREKLNAPTNLNISQNILSWNAVENAESYAVEIAAPNGQKTTKTTTRSLLDLKDVLVVGGKFEFSVKAQTSNENLLESDATKIEFENFVALETPKNLSVNNLAVLSAEIDSRANSVMLKVGNTQKIVEKSASFVQASNNIWQINLKALSASYSGLIDFNTLGNYYISLQAMFSTSAKSYYYPSAVSQNVNFVNSKTLAAPNVEIDRANGLVSWSSSELEFVSGFRVEISLREGDPLTYIFDKTILSLKLPENFVAVSVVALGRDFYLNSPATTKR